MPANQRAKRKSKAKFIQLQGNDKYPEELEGDDLDCYLDWLAAHLASVPMSLTESQAAYVAANPSRSPTQSLRRLHRHLEKCHSVESCEHVPDSDQYEWLVDPDEMESLYVKGEWKFDFSPPYDVPYRAMLGYYLYDVREPCERVSLLYGFFTDCWDGNCK